MWSGALLGHRAPPPTASRPHTALPPDSLQIYQLPGVASTIRMDHIKTHYFSAHPVLNAYSIVPRGPDVLADLTKPHDRDRFTA